MAFNNPIYIVLVYSCFFISNMLYPNKKWKFYTFENEISSINSLI